MKKRYSFLLVLVFLSIMFYAPKLILPKIYDYNYTSASNNYKKAQYSGYVANKFIDSTQHNYKTVILVEKDAVNSIIFDFEIGGLYEFIEINDTIVKDIGSLSISLSRSNLDTIIEMEIYNGPGVN